ncbi:hypothetical protein ACJX0J_028458, partial [Zea mays]
MIICVYIAADICGPLSRNHNFDLIDKELCLFIFDCRNMKSNLIFLLSIMIANLLANSNYLKFNLDKPLLRLIENFYVEKENLEIQCHILLATGDTFPKSQGSEKKKKQEITTTMEIIVLFIISNHNLGTTAQSYLILGGAAAAVPIKKGIKIATISTKRFSSTLIEIIGSILKKINQEHVKNEMDRNTAIQSQIEPDLDQKGTQNQHYGVVSIHKGTQLIFVYRVIDHRSPASCVTGKGVSGEVPLIMSVKIEIAVTLMYGEVIWEMIGEMKIVRD